ncbi:MAG: sigma-70 family RNA polymerase sigma factor [Proteobacteria bacterium]|jgi:RNA polymerase sigma-70 factor (ECF subfamily)|nr:sigma-70 family RNA polymerase sigma factor [Pseudomonadota bacterium]
MRTVSMTTPTRRDGPTADGGAQGEPLLVARAFAGDAEAFEAIVARYQRPVLGLTRRYLRNAADAEDAAQEAFIRAFVHRDRFDAARPLLPWLLAVARHACLDRLRRGRREEIAATVQADDRASDGPTAEDALSDRERLERLSLALDALPEGQREVVAMFHLDGLAYREIAEALDVPIGTVMTWLHRGRARLREAVLAEPAHEGRGEGLRGGAAHDGHAPER